MIQQICDVVFLNLNFKTISTEYITHLQRFSGASSKQSHPNISEIKQHLDMYKILKIVMIKYVDLTDHVMQMQDYVICAKKVQILSKKEKNRICNIVVWLLHIHCAAYGFVTPTQAIK